MDNKLTWSGQGQRNKKTKREDGCVDGWVGRRALTGSLHYPSWPQ